MTEPEHVVIGSVSERADGLVRLLHRARDRGDGLSLTASGVEAILYALGTAAPRCPSPCDPDCEQACHEVHHEPSRQDHYPDTCAGVIVAAARTAERERIRLALLGCSDCGKIHGHVYRPRWRAHHVNLDELIGEQP